MSVSTPSWCKGFVPGIHIEVLWDVQNTTTQGRRKGESVTETVWWRAEVLDVREKGGHTLADLKYEPMGDFETQVGKVRLFPSHVQLLDEHEQTQLRWRFYESSGHISYIVGAEDDANYSTSVDHCDGELQDKRLKQTVGELTRRIEHIERLLTSKQAIACQVRSTNVVVRDRIESLRGLLRHKLAVAAQKPVPCLKQRNNNDEVSHIFDFSYASTIQASIDCSAQDFEGFCAFIDGFVPNVLFKVDGCSFKPSSGQLRAVINSAEVVFESLGGLCEALGVSSFSDIMGIARKKREVGSKGNTDETAVRICGCFLVDCKGDETPSAILVCRCLHDDIPLEKEINVLIRNRRVLDPRSMWYQDHLQRLSLPVSEIVNRVYGSSEHMETPLGCKRRLSRVSSDAGSFSLVWRPSLVPNGKLWTRGMILGSGVVGCLEVRVPYILIRGKRGVDEVLEVTTDSYIARQLYAGGVSGASASQNASKTSGV